MPKAIMNCACFHNKLVERRVWFSEDNDSKEKNLAGSDLHRIGTVLPAIAH